MTATAELSSQLLDQPAPQAVRLIAVTRLADVRASYERLWAGEVDDLHELRVALRRLRSWLRAFRSELGDTLRRKTRRRLSALARSTGSARDAEVALQWIGAQADLKQSHRAGARYMTERLRHDLDVSRKAVRKTLEGNLPKLLGKLSDELGTYWQRQKVDDPSSPPGMRTVTHAVLRQHGDRFIRTVERIESRSDVREAHRARLAAKRLRYLLETLNGHPDAASLVERLTGFQEMLGVVHDSHRIVNRLLREIVECAAHDARNAAHAAVGLDTDDDTPRPPYARVKGGLLWLARSARKREQQAFTAFRRRWRKRKVERVAAEIIALANSLEERAGAD